MERWHGKLAVVTGAGTGIGAAIATALAEAGLTVVGLDVDPKLVWELNNTKIKGDGAIAPLHCDISKAEDIAERLEFVETLGNGIHVLVNNAGVLHQGQITATGTNPLTDEQILSSLDTNLKGTILCTRHAVASMKENGIDDGHIININSLAGHYIPFSSSMNVYASTKHAITAFTESLRYELAEFGSKIRTTSISPGLTQTSMASHIEELDFPALKPKDIADAVLYVLSTPPHVNISELTIQPVMEKRL